MVTYFGKGEILKGSDAELAIELVPCNVHAEASQLENFICYIYTTPEGAAIERTMDDFEVEGNVGTTHLQWEELNELEDGVVRYTLEYDFDESHYKVEKNTGYYLKTPINYNPVQFVTEDDVEDVVFSAMTSSAGTEVIQEIVNEAVNDVVIVEVNGDGEATGNSIETMRAFYNALEEGVVNKCILRRSNPDTGYIYSTGLIEKYSHSSWRITSGGTHTYYMGFRVVYNMYFKKIEVFFGFNEEDENDYKWTVRNTEETSMGLSYYGLITKIDITDPDKPDFLGINLQNRAFASGDTGYFSITEIEYQNMKKMLLNAGVNQQNFKYYVRVNAVSGGTSVGGSEMYRVGSAGFSAAGPIDHYLIGLSFDVPAPMRNWPVPTLEDFNAMRFYKVKLYFFEDGEWVHYKAEIISDSGEYATEEYVQDAVSGLVTEEYVQEVTSGFTTSAETEALITAATQDFLTSADTQDFLTSADTQDFLTSADTQNFITSADTQNFLTSADTANYVTALTSVNKIWGGSAQAYSALTSYDPNAFYFVDPEE